MKHEEFKKLRERLDLSEHDAATLLCVHPQAITRWERDPKLTSARAPDELALQVLRWMAAPGRPRDWPKPNPKGDK